MVGERTEALADNASIILSMIEAKSIKHSAGMMEHFGSRNSLKTTVFRFLDTSD